jgi:hypothetical protein
VRQVRRQRGGRVFDQLGVGVSGSHPQRAERERRAAEEMPPREVLEAIVVELLVEIHGGWEVIGGKCQVPSDQCRVIGFIDTKRWAWVECRVKRKKEKVKGWTAWLLV